LLDLQALGFPFSPDDGKGNVFQFCNSSQFDFSGFNACLILGVKFLAFLGTMQRRDLVARTFLNVPQTPIWAEVSEVFLQALDTQSPINGIGLERIMALRVVYVRHHNKKSSIHLGL